MRLHTLHVRWLDLGSLTEILLGWSLLPLGSGSQYSGRQSAMAMHQHGLSERNTARIVAQHPRTAYQEPGRRRMRW